MTRVPVVLDADPGIDDVIALALAARSPELDLVAVTTTYGNATLARTTANARQVLGLAGRPAVPVLAGADRPLAGPPPGPSEKHGPSGVGYAEADRRAGGAAVTANPDALVRALALLPAGAPPAVLVTLGPLTNLAHALRRDAPLVRARVRRHVAVLDHEDLRPSVPRPAGPPARPGFNYACDPDAAAIALDAGLPSDLVGQDVTRRVVIPAAATVRLRLSSDPLVRWLTDALRWSVEVHRRLHGIPGCWVHDAVATAGVARPALLAFTRRGMEIGGARVARRARVAAVLRLLDRVFGPAWDQPPAGGA